MNTRASPFRRALQGALLATLLASAPAHATGLPGAAPAPQQPIPAYADPRVGSFFVTYADKRLQPTIVDLKRLDACIATIRVHAGNRPARFNTPDEAQRARRDALMLGLQMAQLTKHDAAPPAFLLRAAIALSLADNLGAPAAAELADERFAKLLAKVPDNAEALYEYGVYLTNRGRPSEALPKLERALAAGEERARWPLALSLAALDRNAEAQVHLEELQARSSNIARDYPVTETLAALRATPAKP